MQANRPTRRGSRQAGQSLIETALLIPLLLLLVFNVINFGYYFIVALQLASAPREGVEYSIQGFQTPGQVNLAPAGPASNTMSVSYLTYQDMNRLAGSASTPMRVCTKSIAGGTNGTGSSQTAKCAYFNGASSATFTGPASDPEAPLFVLHRVDVQYTITPIIPAEVFGLTVLPNLTFHRQVSMRAMD
ncbi:MAG TPA: TadE/TadG family type IV pilus assembly protein [Clostridia bacterium]|nr:TadE/TadG family type IV pilus assembly protein [Clostridia bacterium]